MLESGSYGSGGAVHFCFFQPLGSFLSIALRSLFSVILYFLFSNISTFCPYPYVLFVVPYNDPSIYSTYCSNYLILSWIDGFTLVLSGLNPTWSAIYLCSSTQTDHPSLSQPAIRHWSWEPSSYPERQHQQLCLVFFIRLPWGVILLCSDRKW